MLVEDKTPGPGTKNSLSNVFILTAIAFFLSFFLFMAAPAASGSSQARGQIGAAAAGLYHSHGNSGSQVHL